MSSHEVKLTSSISVSKYLELEHANNREVLGKFIRDRFEERYFKPIQNSPSKHGFTCLAVSCVVIETLESFYQGLSDTKNKSSQIFEHFFKRDTPFKVFSSNDNWFYKDIRCGILHQSEVKGGWRISRKGPLINEEAKIINAEVFLQELKILVGAYSRELINNDAYWEKFKKKMKTVCANCEKS